MEKQTLWAPWRTGFILGKKEKGCVFCNRLKMKDSLKNLILFRGEHSFIILNKFPYNPGHTLIVPYRHTGQLERLSEKESAELFELSRKSVAAMKRVFKPTAFNLGMNLGRTAGAGLPGHLHMHVVPRWAGDNNFMPIIGKTPIISLPLGPIYKSLRQELNAK